MIRSVLVIQQANWRSSMRRQLIAWFAKNARDLPWRRHPEPYRVWVSEVMLQQTQVSTVIDYYHRFLAAFPDVTALANADEADLMRIWEGLGYYRRARLMHQAAKEIVKVYGGQFPTDYERVLALPGIGRYTAGAILSIATDAKLPILEGNTVRVFSRWVAMQEDVKSKEGVSQLWDIAESMLPRTEAGRFNQAAMELGALVCKPLAPLCDQCPVSRGCQAYRLGLQQTIPGKVTKMVYEDCREYAFVVPAVDQGGWLVHRIPDDERWAGLWDFPRVTGGVATGVNDAATIISRRTGAEILPLSHFKTIKHAVTRFRITLEVHQTRPIAAIDLAPVTGEYRFVTAGELAKLPLSVTGRKIAKQLVSNE
jgi:A/G-specific adenine glycosylase